MADTFTSSLGVLLMATGGDNNAWGTNLNNSALQILEDAIANQLITVAAGGQLGTSNTLDLSGSPPPAGPSAARFAVLYFQGAITANQTVKVPNLAKNWLVINETTGAFTVSMKTPTGAAAVIPQVNVGSGFQRVICDGNNFIGVSPFNYLQVQMPDGGISAPPYSSVNEPNSGWRRAGTQDWRLTINGVDSLQVTGPGAAAPSAVNIVSPGALYFNGVKFDQTAVIQTGTEAYYAGLVAPSGWILEFGQAINRTTFLNLFNAITATNVGNTHGTTTIDGLSADMRGLGVEGALIEGTGISLGTTIVSVAASSMVLSAAVTGTNTGVTFRILPYGQGDGSTTFTLPDRRGRFTAGRDNMGGTAAGNLTGQTNGILGTKLNATGGEEQHVLTTPQLPSHNHTITDPGHTHAFNTTDIETQGNTGGQPHSTVATGAGNNLPAIASAVTGITINNTGGGGGHNTVPPASISNMMIKS